jgi:hypothetical protein
MDENAADDVSEHDSSFTAGAGVPEETITARRFLGSCAPREKNSSPAPSKASASGAVPEAAAFSFGDVPTPQHASGSFL